MTPLAHALEHVEPTMVALPGGGWLAVAGPGKGVRLGVCASTPAEARTRFDQEFSRLCELVATGCEH